MPENGQEYKDSQDAKGYEEITPTEMEDALREPVATPVEESAYAQYRLSRDNEFWDGWYDMMMGHVNGVGQAQRIGDDVSMLVILNAMQDTINTVRSIVTSEIMDRAELIRQEMQIIRKAEELKRQEEAENAAAVQVVTEDSEDSPSI